MAVNESKARRGSPQWDKWHEVGAIGYGRPTMDSALRPHGLPITATEPVPDTVPARTQLTVGEIVLWENTPNERHTGDPQIVVTVPGGDRFKVGQVLKRFPDHTELVYGSF